MTIDNLVEKKRKIDTTVATAQNLDKDLSTALSGLSDKLQGDQQKLLDSLRTVLYAMSQTNKDRHALLMDYSNLLSDIMRETEISWPPKCIASLGRS